MTQDNNATEPLRIISYGGGVQSTALVVLAATGKLDDVMGGPVTAALMSNVGDDSENPATITYVRQIIIPWAQQHDFEVLEIQRTNKDNQITETLYQRLTNMDHRSIGIPVRMSNGAPGNRTCTSEYKIKVIAKWLRQHGATKTNKAVVAIGISTDEIQRASNRQPIAYETAVYPLLDLGLDRADCASIIRKAGLPVPPKSSCYFCPFHSRRTWAEMRRDDPTLFAKAVELERIINIKRTKLGKDNVWLSDLLQPIDTITEAQASLFETEGHQSCDSGYCWT